MNFIFLSPHFPPYYRRFCQRLHEHGVQVLGIGDVPRESLHPALAEALTDYQQVDSLLDYDQLLRAVGALIHRHGRIDRLDSLNDYWLETEARLRTDFHIPGLQFEQARRLRQKSRMKQVFQQQGIPTARFAPLDTLAGAQAFLKDIGYPAVIKRDIASGAGMLQMVTDEADLFHFFSRPHQHAYILEEYVPGRSLTFDGIVDAQGRVLYAASHLFPAFPAGGIPRKPHLAFHSLLRVEEELVVLGSRVLHAFDITERFFHLEFIRLTEDKPGLGKSGDLIALQVNMRAPAGMLTDMMHYANGVDVYGMWADMIVYGRLTRPTMEAQFIGGYAARMENQAYLHSHEDILKQYGPYISHHLPVPAMMAGAMGDYVYLFRAKSEEEIEEITGYILLRDDKEKLPE